MNKRIRKKKITQKRNASRKLILSMNEGVDRDRMLMTHVIRFGDYGFFRKVIGPGYYIVPARMSSTKLLYNIALEYFNKKEKEND